MSASPSLRAHPLAAVAIAAAFCGACGRADRSHPRPNVLLVTIDTFRADRLGAGVAPALDRLADSSIRFTAARTAAPLTLPSHTTLLTGLLPPAHGVRENGIDALDAAHPTLATLLKTAGYSTAAFVGAFVLDRRFGLAHGFDTYDDRIPRDPAATERLEAERPASAVIDRAIAWLDSWVQNQQTPPAPPASPASPAPFFAWIHLYDPHAPYTPPPEFRAHAATAYDGEVAYVDAQVARVLEWLRAHQQMERTLVVIAGDHGEGLGDHGESTHGMLVYDSTLRVPLIIASPGAAPARRDDAVSLAEIAPTILRAARVTPPVEMKGRDLLAEVRLKPDTTGSSNEPDRAGSTGNVGSQPNAASVRFQPDLYSETEYPRVAGWAPLQAFTDGRWKTIRAGAASEVYDLQSDPREQHDLSAAQPNVATAMSSRIAALRAGGATAARTISPDTERRLRSLGYVASPAQATGDSTMANPASHIADWNLFEDALALLNAHRPDALSALEALTRRSPDALVFRATYARALKEAGHLDRALAVYREAASRWTTDATLLHDLAVAAREAALHAHGAAAVRLREESARAEQAAIALAPASATAHNGLGLMAIDADRPRDAVAEFQRATDADPNNAGYWANLGNARRALGDRAGAEQAYRRALDVDARAADAANGLGVLLVEAQRPADAVPWLERAVAAAPEFAEARLNLGIALQQAGQPARAADVYRSILAGAPAHTRERDAAAKLLAGLGAAR